MSRKPYNSQNKVLDMQKRKVTKFNAWVGFQKTALVKKESENMMRSEDFSRIFSSYASSHCGKKGEQVSNLTSSQMSA